MLKSLTDETRKEADTIDPAYVVELFNYYAPTYDSHMKDSLLYTAPR
jgi:predicted TPR repeat methyltransferase